MSFATLAVTSALCAVPCEYHIDCSSWNGAFVNEYTMRTTAWDGSVVAVTVEIQPKTDGEVARYPLWRDLNEAGWRTQQVGKNILVVYGSKDSPIRSVEFTSKQWKPTVRWVPLDPKKK